MLGKVDDSGNQVGGWARPIRSQPKRCDRGGAIHTPIGQPAPKTCPGFTVDSLSLSRTWPDSQYSPPRFTVFRPRFTLSITLPPRGRPSTCPGTTHPRFVLASLVSFLMGVCASTSSTSKDVLHPFANAPNRLQNVSKISRCAHLCQCHPILVSNFPSRF
jgi:hypothetical protein